MGQQRSVRGGNGRTCVVRVLQWMHEGEACGCGVMVGRRQVVDGLEAVSGTHDGGRSKGNEGCMLAAPPWVVGRWRRMRGLQKQE
eukprot:2521044-Prorocentrum_lima.AAC.1